MFGDIRDELGQKVEEEIQELGDDATYVHLDVTKEPDWERVIELAERKYGKLNVLVNNAAILIRKEIEDTTEEDWDLIMDVNAKGVFLGTKHAIPAMRRAGGGSIVNISSIPGLVGIGPAAYIATKGAVRLLTKSTAIQYAKDNIRANSDHPGGVDTPMIHDVPAAPASQPEVVLRTLMGRRAAPEEIAYGVLYLASDEASFVTGPAQCMEGRRPSSPSIHWAGPGTRSHPGTGRLGEPGEEGTKRGSLRCPPRSLLWSPSSCPTRSRTAKGLMPPWPYAKGNWVTFLRDWPCQTPNAHLRAGMTLVDSTPDRGYILIILLD